MHSEDFESDRANKAFFAQKRDRPSNIAREALHAVIDNGGMQKSKLGKSNLEVSALDLGCMGLSFNSSLEPVETFGQSESGNR